MRANNYLVSARAALHVFYFYAAGVFLLAPSLPTQRTFALENRRAGEPCAPARAGEPCPAFPMAGEPCPALPRAGEPRAREDEGRRALLCVSEGRRTLPSASAAPASA